MKNPDLFRNKTSEWVNICILGSKHWSMQEEKMIAVFMSDSWFHFSNERFQLTLSSPQIIKNWNICSCISCNSPFPLIAWWWLCAKGTNLNFNTMTRGKQPCDLIYFSIQHLHTEKNKWCKFKITDYWHLN